MLNISFNYVLFLVGILGIVLNRQSIIVTIMGIELMLLALNFNFVTFSVYLDDIIGQVFCLFILTVAASEPSIGLAIVICYLRFFGSIILGEKVDPVSSILRE